MTAIAILALCLDDSVSDLVRLLTDDSVEVRDEAAAQLVRRGEAVRPPLVETRKGTSDAELRARIDDVLGRLDRDRRRQAFAGGPAVDGLAAGLRVREDKLARELRLTLELMNVGREARDVALVSSWDSRMPGRSFSSSGSGARLVVAQIGGAFPGGFTSTRACGGTPVWTWVRLQPGESRTFERTLALKDLAPGDYTVHAEYYAKKLLGSPDDLRTDTAYFKVAAEK